MSRKAWHRKHDHKVAGGAISALADRFGTSKEAMQHIEQGKHIDWSITASKEGRLLTA